MEIVIKPIISVLMSIYSEPLTWITESIESILEQTYRDFEFIVINDNPERDDNRVLLKKYSIQDDRIIIVENHENIGLTKSLNKGLEIAKGKYIARMDADDISIKNRFEIQLQYMESHPEVFCCGSQALIIDENNNEIGKFNHPTSDQEIRSLLPVENHMIHPSLFYRNSNLRYDEGLRYAQDYGFIVGCAQKGKLANIGLPLLKYRRSDIQIGRSKLSLQDEAADSVRLNYIKSLAPSSSNCLWEEVRNGWLNNKKDEGFLFAYIVLGSKFKMVPLKYLLSDFLRLPVNYKWKIKLLISHFL